MIHGKNNEAFAPSSSPERHHVAKLCWQAPDLIGRQVQEHKVVQLGNFRWDAWQGVATEVQSSEVRERPKARAETPNITWDINKY